MTSHRIGTLAIALIGAMGVGGAHALPALQNATSIGAGSNHACAALAGGGASCWGSNDARILARTTSGYAAGAVQGLDALLVRIAVGGGHACAAGTDGRLWCWGDNYSGQLGLGAGISESRSPALVTAVSGVTDVAAALRHTCAVAQQAAYCWGANAVRRDRRRHDGPAEPSGPSAPVSASGVTRVAAGGFDYYSEGFSCAVAGGGVWCWGANGSGQLGDGTGTQRLAPVPVTGLPANATDVAAGSRHACAVQGGAVLCWGDNADGQLGDGTFATRLAPVFVVNAGAECSGWPPAGGIAARFATMVRCFAGAAILPASSATERWTRGRLPHPSPVSPDWSSMSRWAASPRAPSLGRAPCSASDRTRADARNGTLSPRVKAVEVKGVPAGFAKLTAGGGHTCATTGAGAALCWGDGSYGQLGNGKLVVGAYPQGVMSLAGGTVAISAGSQHTCARTGTGGAFCWGTGCDGPAGKRLPKQRARAFRRPGAHLGRRRHRCRRPVQLYDRGRRGEVLGHNIRGSLGIGGTLQLSNVPVDVLGMQQGVTRIVAGYEHGCALRSGGGVKCWGANGEGQVGDATANDRFTPVDVLGLASGIVDIAAGTQHTCAATQSGTVLCWGANWSGQLGDGTTQRRSVPVQVGAAAGQRGAGDRRSGAHLCAAAGRRSALLGP